MSKKMLSSQVHKMNCKVKSLESSLGIEFDINRTPVSYMYRVNRYNHYIDVLNFEDKDVSLMPLYEALIASYVDDGFSIRHRDNVMVALVATMHDKLIRVTMILTENEHVNKILWDCSM